MWMALFVLAFSKYKQMLAKKKYELKGFKSGKKKYMIFRWENGVIFLQEEFWLPFSFDTLGSFCWFSVCKQKNKSKYSILEGT